MNFFKDKEKEFTWIEKNEATFKDGTRVVYELNDNEELRKQNYDYAFIQTRTHNKIYLEKNGRVGGINGFCNL